MIFQIEQKHKALFLHRSRRPQQGAEGGRRGQGGKTAFSILDLRWSGKPEPSLTRGKALAGAIDMVEDEIDNSHCVALGLALL